MQIFIKTLYGKTLTLDVDPSDVIARVKHLIYCKVGIPVEQFKLKSSLKYLEDYNRLCDYNI